MILTLLNILFIFFMFIVICVCCLNCKACTYSYKLIFEILKFIGYTILYSVAFITLAYMILRVTSYGLSIY